MIAQLFAGEVNLIPMSGLAGLLVVVGYQTSQPQQIAMVWQSGLVAHSDGLDAIGNFGLAATVCDPDQGRHFSHAARVRRL